MFDIPCPWLPGHAGSSVGVTGSGRDAEGVLHGPGEAACGAFGASAVKTDDVLLLLKLALILAPTLALSVANSRRFTSPRAT